MEIERGKYAAIQDFYGSRKNKNSKFSVLSIRDEISDAILDSNSNYPKKIKLWKSKSPGDSIKLISETKLIQDISNLLLRRRRGLDPNRMKETAHDILCPRPRAQTESTIVKLMIGDKKNLYRNLFDLAVAIIEGQASILPELMQLKGLIVPDYKRTETHMDGMFSRYISVIWKWEDFRKEFPEFNDVRFEDIAKSPKDFQGLSSIKRNRTRNTGDFITTIIGDNRFPSNKEAPFFYERTKKRAALAGSRIMEAHRKIGEALSAQ